MWTWLRPSTASAGPFSGHPSSTHRSSLTRAGGENVAPPIARHRERDVADVASVDVAPRRVERPVGPDRNRRLAAVAHAAGERAGAVHPIDAAEEQLRQLRARDAVRRSAAWPAGSCPAWGAPPLPPRLERRHGDPARQTRCVPGGRRQSPASPDCPARRCREASPDGRTICPPSPERAAIRRVPVTARRSTPPRWRARLPHAAPTSLAAAARPRAWPALAASLTRVGAPNVRPPSRLAAT